MVNFAPWFYRNLLVENEIIHRPEYFETVLINGLKQFEANVFLKDSLRPSWVEDSVIYKNCDGSGADTHKNIAIYKAISESLERLAFYELADTYNKKFYFDLNPTTTGMAAYPSITCGQARRNAKAEAVERWALHEFNYKRLPVIKHSSTVQGLLFFEIITPISDVKVSLLCYEKNGLYVYGFSGGSDLKKSYNKAIIELDRNLRMLSRISDILKVDDFNSSVDKTFIFFSKKEGHDLFMDKINNAPRTILSKNPKILCDLEMHGRWSKYTKIWRYLLEDSYYDYKSDYHFFMF